jgi:predicted nucleic acid-binding protein
MSARFFLDTNIFVYSFDLNATAKATQAQQLIREALISRKGIISYQVVQEFFNVALKRFSRPMTTAEAEQYLGTVFRPLLAVHSSSALYGEALRTREVSRTSWYDSLIVSAAIQSGCKRLYSEDLQHGQKFGSLQVVNPFI